MSDAPATPPVAVAVVSYNTRDLLDACLASLEPDARAGLVEVWVHDNDSPDGSADMVAERHPWVRLVRGENIGYGPAVNRVAEQAGGDWIVASNADVQVLPGAIATMLETARRDPQAAVIVPRLILPDGSTQTAIGAFPTVARAVARFLLLDRLGPARVRIWMTPYHDQERGRRVDWAAGAFLLIRREAFDAVGGFDESQFMYAEDLDISWRLRRRGGFTRYEPDAHVRHEHRASATEAFGDSVRQREIQAVWEWSARRLGTARTVAIGSLGVLQGAIRVVAGFVLRRDADSRARARWWVRSGLDGIRTALAARRRP